MPNKIYAGPAPRNNPLLVEGAAIAAVLPGTLVKQVTAGIDVSDKLPTVFDSECIVAIEQGSNVGATIDTAYEIGENVKAVVAQSGDFVQVLTAVGANITSKGVAMSSNSNGTLKIAATDGTEQILFYSDEIKNVTGSPQLVLMRKA